MKIIKKADYILRPFWIKEGILKIKKAAFRAAFFMYLKELNIG